MNPVMYIVMPTQRALKMTPGKMAAQAAHAAVEAYRLSCKSHGGHFEESSIANLWRLGGHYTKIVLQADDLELAQRYIEARSFTTALIIDEGRTEFDNKLTPTALGCAIVDKDSPHVRETFGMFNLWKEEPPKRSFRAAWEYLKEYE